MTQKLVIIDDEEFIRMPLKDYFEDCGWSVEVFDSAIDALEYIEKDDTDCVIVDMRLPGMTGVEFITRAHGLKPQTRFVIYTGSIDFTITEDLREFGIDDRCIVRKPALELSELRRAVEGGE